jgi:REP element-mobilizing transposase RayT
MIKSITAREIFYKVPSVKKILWRGEFWSDGYFASSVSKHGNENTISKYIKNQGQEYQVLHEDRQVALFYNTPLPF